MNKLSQFPKKDPYRPIVFSPITVSSSVRRVPLAHSQACNPAHYRGLPHLTAVETDFVC